MTPEETAAGLHARLAQLGYPLQPASIAGIPGQVGRKRTTHWPTLTSLHMFVGVGLSAPHPDAAAAYTSALLDHACETKGGVPRGLQTGILATAFVIVPSADPASRQAVTTQIPRKRFAAMSAGVLVDAAEGTYYTFQGRQLIGRAYKNMFNRTIQDATSGLLRPGTV